MVTGRRFPRQAPYVVAAIDGNHDGRVAMARRLVTLAADAGAHAVKFSISAGGNAPARGLAPTAWRTLRRDTRGRIDLILAPHDTADLAVARRVKPDAYQVDPDALSNVQLLRGIARERLPVLVVAGACTTRTLRTALDALRACPVVVLHTVLAGALPASRARLRYVLWLAEKFGKPVGYLGHEPGAGWATVAATLGALVIEKPFTLDRTLPGATHAASIDAAELARMVTNLRDVSAALEPVGDRRVFSDELPALERTGRSLVARRALRQGRALRASDIVSRPAGDGLSPRLAEWLVGRRLKYDVEAGEPLTFGMVDVE